MDWSSVYEDEGEGQGDWAARGDGDREDEGSVRTKLIASFSARGQYTPLICYAFTVNYILGVGCLGIPYAFLQSGLVLGSVLLLVLSCISYVTVMWVFAATQQEISISSYLALTNPFVLTPRSALARRKRYVKSLRHGGDPASASAAASRGREESTPLLFSGGGAGKGLGQTVYASLSNLLVPSNVSNTSNTSTAVHSISNASHGSAAAGPATGRAGGGLQELEVVDLVRDFLGERARLAYQVSLMALTYIGLLAYAQVFAATFRQQLWPQASPATAVALFALAVVPLLVLIPALGSSPDELLTSLGWALIKATVLVGILLTGGQRFMRWWLTLVARRKSDELFMLNLLLITLGLAWLTEHAGLSLALGAFVAGMLISETEFKHQVETDIRPFHDVLLGLFFITIGMILDWRLHMLDDMLRLGDAGEDKLKERLARAGHMPAPPATTSNE
eukprot:gene38297-46540_t